MLSSKLHGVLRNLTSTVKIQNNRPTEQCYFEHVFSFPLVKYIALVNRLKIYHLYGTGIVVPSSGILELLNIVSDNTFLISSYIGVTGAVVLALGTLPFRNIIGHLYISEDNEKIKISAVGYSGKRIDRIVSVNDWIPLLEMKPKKTDLLFLSPQLRDGTKYKLFVKFGHVKNPIKMGQVLE
ncbi:uncharacterized protein LOC123871669 [Maniola jurtina]|uniref:uncharacterized protein LOC123871669 n=1 Tax=Maniola jurtina TaxID=191418 RepID=UPI001E68E278|nr:uncharacterized protein LOC123871669 [Maniola jurtina]